MPKEQESILIDQLKDMAAQYGLVTASFADRQSAAYYNQDGFLRNLTPEQDAWFYGYTKSQQDLMLSIFRESNGEVKLFVNFQQLNGRGLAGLAKSLDSMVSMLANFRIGDSGFVFMTDGSGKVKLHPDASRIDRDSLAQLASGSGNLLNKQPLPPPTPRSTVSRWCWPAATFRCSTGIWWPRCRKRRSMPNWTAPACTSCW